MKKFITILLIILLTFTYCTSFAEGVKSPTLKDLYGWTPEFNWTLIEENPTLEDLKSITSIIEYFLGKDYIIYDAFKLEVKPRASIVEYKAPYFNLESNYLVVLMNEVNTYFLTPSFKNDFIISMDFTNVEEAEYVFYLLTKN